MNNLKRKSNFLAAFLAFAHMIIGGVTAVSSNLEALEMYNGSDPYGSMSLRMQARLPSTIVSSLIQYIPALLFVIYALFFYRKKKNHPLLMGSFAFSTALTLWNIISVILSIFAMSKYIGFSNSPYTQGDLLEQYLPRLTVYAVMLVIYIFFLIDSARGFRLVNVSKVFSLIMAAAFCANPILSLITNEKFREKTEAAMIESIVEEVAAADVFVTFLIPLLLALAFIVFWWMAATNDNAKLSKSDLDKLRKKFESGKIDEQTYQRKRAEMLDRI